jgi:hypothetical protein
VGDRLSKARDSARDSGRWLAGVGVAGTVMAVLATLDDAVPAFAEFMTGATAVVGILALVAFVGWFIVTWVFGYDRRLNQEVRLAWRENGAKAEALNRAHLSAVNAPQRVRGDITVVRGTPDRLGSPPPGTLPPTR